MLGVLYHLAASFLRWFTGVRSRSVRDAYLFLFAALFKAYRIFTLWIAVFVIEKVYQQAYVERVFLAEDAEKNTSPPSLGGFVAAVMAVEAVTAGAFFAVLGLLRAGGTGSAYVVDTPMLAMLFMDYLLSTSVVLAAGALVARTVQDRRLFRYGHDGLRAVRAHAIMTLKLAMVILAIPFFMI
jgi:hypothetical protein